MSNFIELTFTQCKQLKSNDVELSEFITEIENQPQWIKDAGVIDSVYELQSIQQGGCASGAYMPAVTYYTAKQIMNEFGDDILDYIQSELGELPKPNDNESWDGMAVFYFSYAVELWVSQFNLDGVNWD